MIVTNTTFRAVPWADVLFAMDLCWWDMYYSEARRTVAGQLFTTCKGAVEKYGLETAMVDGRIFQPFGNSGAGAIQLAALSGARRIILAGYDCQHTDGKAHHHGDHPKKLGNAVRPDAWVKNFDKLAKELAALDIVNASRATALRCWPRIELREALNEGGQQRRVV